MTSSELKHLQAIVDRERAVTAFLNKLTSLVEKIENYLDEEHQRRSK